MASPMTRLPEFGSTENLVKALFSLGQKKNDDVNLHHLEQLCHLVVSLHRDPLLAQDVWKVGLVPKLIEFSKCGEVRFERQARMALSLVGQAPPYAGRGLRILSVDGGGTRFVLKLNDYTLLGTPPPPPPHPPPPPPPSLALFFWGGGGGGKNKGREAVYYLIDDSATVYSVHPYATFFDSFSIAQAYKLLVYVFYAYCRHEFVLKRPTFTCALASQ